MMQHGELGGRGTCCEHNQCEVPTFVPPEPVLTLLLLLPPLFVRIVLLMAAALLQCRPLTRQDL